MKTLICIPCLLTGGTEIQTLNTVHALVQEDHEVTVACYFEHSPYMVERYRKAGAKVQFFSLEGTRVGGYRAIPYLYKHLRRTIREVRPDVTHVQYMAPGAMVILLLWLMGVKNIIATAHTAADIYKDLRLLHFIQRHCLRAFTCITERAERSFFGTSQLYSAETVLGRRNHFTIYNCLTLNGESLMINGESSQPTDKVRANEQESNSFELLQRQRERSVGCDEENFSSPEEKQLVALQPKLCDEVTNGQQTGLSDENFGLTQTSQTDTDAINAANISQQNLDTKTQNGKSLRPCCHPDGNCPPRLGVTSEAEGVFSKLYTLTTQRSESNICSHNIAEQASGLKCKAFINSKPNTIGVVSRLEPIKGMDLVVPAFAEVLKQHPDVRLLVVGDGSLRATMEQQAVELGCADHITWVGRQPQEELAQWYGQMDIVLMPSRSEGFGLTAIEAMANGCVMVASDVGGLPEVVRDGVCGLLHRSEDVHDMAAKVCMLLGDAALYDRLRSQSLIEVEKYSFDHYAALINNLYGKLAQSNEL